MFTPYHAIVFGILLKKVSASIFQMSEGEKGLRKFKHRFQSIIRFEQLLNYF